VEFFKEMPHETSLNLLRSFRFQKQERGHEVFKYGETGKLFYIILKGAVDILTPMNNNFQNATTRNELPKSTHNENSINTSRRRSSIISLFAPKNARKSPDPSKKEPKSSTTTKPNSNRKLTINNLAPGKIELNAPSIAEVDENNESMMSCDHLLAQYPDHILLNTLRDGEHFGEIALSFQCQRTATVVCRETCYFMTLNSSAYYRILSDYHETVQQELLKFLRSLSMTKDWPSENILGLMRQLKPIQAKRNHVVYDYGYPVEMIYFIRNGEIELTKKTDVKIEEDEVFKLTAKKRQPFNFDKAQYMMVNSVWKNQYEKMQSQDIRVALLGAGQNFGEEELIGDSEIRFSKAKVKSQTADLLVISLEVKFI